MDYGFSLLNRVRDNALHAFNDATSAVGNFINHDVVQPTQRVVNNFQSNPQVQQVEHQAAQLPQQAASSFQDILNQISRQPIINSPLPFKRIDSPTIGDALGIIRDTGQAVARNFAGLEQTGLHAVNRNIPQELPVGTLSPAAQALFGKNQTIRSIGGTKDFLQKEGVAAPIAFGLAVADPLTGLSVGKSLAEQGVKQVAKGTIKAAGKTLGQLQEESQRARGLGFLADLDAALRDKNYNLAREIGNKIKAAPKGSPYDPYKPQVDKLVPQSILPHSLQEAERGFISFGKEVGKDTGTNAVKIASQIKKMVDQEATKALDYLPRHAVELQSEIDTLKATMKARPLLNRVSKGTVAETKTLQLFLKDKEKELKDVMSQITKLSKTNPPKNTATLLASKKGILNLTKPVDNTAQLDNTVVRAGEINRSLPPSSGTLQLPSGEALRLAAPQKTVTLTQLKKLMAQGDNLEGVTFIAKDANEARQVAILGLDASKIVVAGKGIRATSTLFAGKEGVSKSVNPARELLNQSVKTNATTTKFPNIFTRGTLEKNRLLPKMLGEVSDAAKKAIFDPLQKAKGDVAVWKSEWLKQVQKNVPFSAGSKESAAIQQFGEGVKSAEQLIKEFGQDKAAQIVKADVFFRNTYDEVLNTVNARRIADGLEPIAKREDYYRHFTEDGGSWLDNLLTGNTGRGTLSEGILKQRTGNKTIYDAVGGFGEYINKAGRAGFTDKFAGDIESLGRALTKNGANPRIGAYLTKYAKEGILGQKDIESTNRILNIGLKLVEGLGKRVRMNAILFNGRALVMQTANVPNAVSQVLGTDPRGAKYIAQGITTLRKNAAVMAESPFLRDRSYHLPISFVRGKVNKVLETGGRLLQQGDIAPTRYVWNTFYEQALGNKVANPIQYADDWTKLMVAGRGLGDLSGAQSSKLGNAVFPFGVEWANSAHVLGDQIGKGQLGALVSTLAAYHLFNRGIKAATGSPGLFDPIQAVMDAYEYQVGSDKKEQNSLKAVGRLLGEMANASPYTANILAAAYPAAKWATGGKDSPLPSSGEVFGGDDPTRFGTVSLYKPKVGADLPKTSLGLFSQYSPVGGGAQIKKTTEGLIAGQRGYTESAAGNVFNTVPQDSLSRARMAVFGQWSPGESSKNFTNDFTRPLTPDEKSVLETLPEDEKKAFVDERNKQTIEFNKANPRDSWFSKTFGGGDKVLSDEMPTTRAGKQAYNKAVDIKLESGVGVSDQALRNRFFDGKTYGKKLGDDQAILEGVVKLTKDELETPEQVATIAQAAGVPGEDLDYYKRAAADDQEKLQEVLAYAQGENADRGVLISRLALDRMVVGGKQVMTTAVIDRLYDEGLIDKPEKAFLTAVKYDQVFKKFYMDRDYKGGGAGGVTVAKLRAFTRSLNALHKNPFGESNQVKLKSINPVTSAKAGKAPKLNLATKKTTQPSKSSKQWFQSY